jgi:23S rRNA (uracil1939-C5)-methyltransferase
MEYAGLESLQRPTVVDAYGGIGTIALFMAGRAKKAYGLEGVPGAVEDSRRNAVLNKIDNVEFIQGRVESILPGMAALGTRPEVVVLDPPRGGCRREVLEAVAAMGTPRVVYVSCDPGTLARDLGRLTGMGYRVEEVQPVDMFPWTHHVECVVKITRRNSC